MFIIRLLSGPGTFIDKLALILGFILIGGFSIIIHEWSHGYVALLNGDLTAKAAGRLSFNPKVHFEVKGLIFLLLIGFGWAKPVPINSMNFRNYKKGMITVSFAGTNTVYNVVPNVTAAGFNTENTALLMDKSGKSGLVPSAIDNELTRSAAFDGRYVYVAARKDGNFVYAWDVENPTADPAELDLGSVVAGGSWVVSDVRYVEEKIYVSNMVMNQDQVFKVYKWDGKDDDTPEVVLEYTVPGENIRLGDAISVIGNPPENGYIFASNFAWPNNASEFYVWNFNNKKNPSPTILPIVPGVALRMGQYGRVNTIPGDPTKLLLTGAEIPLAVINFSGTFLYEATEPMI
ncbi:MAG: DUF4623 domain-containing protein, partial [Candidatus Moranbacteria bacterium]|nr:DUF4623 domain-containing protein [Candidatus Moranbacteria bacterium]